MWAIVEIMGHRQRAGRVGDRQIAGGTMLAIEHPTLADHTGDEPLTEYYAASAIFAIRPCSEEQARVVAEAYWRATTETPALAAPLDELVYEENLGTCRYCGGCDDIVDDAGFCPSCA